MITDMMKQDVDVDEVDVCAGHGRLSDCDSNDNSNHTDVSLMCVYLLGAAHAQHAQFKSIQSIQSRQTFSCPLAI